MMTESSAPAEVALTFLKRPIHAMNQGATFGTAVCGKTFAIMLEGRRGESAGAWAYLLLTTVMFVGIVAAFLWWTW